MFPFNHLFIHTQMYLYTTHSGIKISHKVQQKANVSIPSGISAKISVTVFRVQGKAMSSRAD